MKYLWFLPAAYIPSIATILIMLGGFAIMMRRNVAGISFIVTAFLLLIAPVFDPAIDAAVDGGFTLGEYIFHELPWWAIVVVVFVAPLLIVKAIIEFIFDRETASKTTAMLLAAIIKLISKGLLYCSPVLVILAGYWYFFR